jgi:hypothetical protein
MTESSASTSHVTVQIKVVLKSCRLAALAFTELTAKFCTVDSVKLAIISCNLVSSSAVGFASAVIVNSTETETVSSVVGYRVGDKEGGNFVGVSVGYGEVVVGAKLGTRDGFGVGDVVGCPVGNGVGAKEGDADGMEVGVAVGAMVGVSVGAKEGAEVGKELGT